MTFYKNRAGNIVEMINGEVYVLREDGRFATASVYDGANVVVTLTGWAATTTNGNTLFQTDSGGWIDLTDGWKSRGTSSAYSVRTAQKYVDTIIRNNATILENNLVCARFASKLTATELNELRGLQDRLVARNESLLNEGIVTDIKTSYPKGYANLAEDLANVMNSGGVGVVISTTVVLVVSAIVVASLGTAAYFAYKYMAQESEQDVKYSKDLTRVLTSKLTEEEYQQLRDETAGIVTKARIKHSLSNWGTAGKILLFAGVAVGLGILIKKYLNV